MELLQFVFSDFWIWLGSFCLLYCILDKLADIVRACKRNKAIHIYEGPSGRTITVDNATEADIRKALNGALDDIVRKEEGVNEHSNS